MMAGASISGEVPPAAFVSQASAAATVAEYSSGALWNAAQQSVVVEMLLMDFVVSPQPPSVLAWATSQSKPPLI